VTPKRGDRLTLPNAARCSWPAAEKETLAFFSNPLTAVDCGTLDWCVLNSTRIVRRPVFETERCREPGKGCDTCWVALS
jgi:hypothetical protein